MIPEYVIEIAQSEFQTEWLKLELAGMPLDVLRVCNPDSMLDDETLLAGHDEVAYQPYWAQAWDAAIAYADVLSAQDFENQTVLDLGCGLGITGAVVAAKGGKVTLGDYAPPALDFAKVNTWPWRQNVHIRKIDWRKDHLDLTFDRIVAADILYDRNDIPFLDRFWRAHLADGASVEHADPSRALTVDFFRDFRDLGWKVEIQSIESKLIKQPLRLATFTI